MFIRILIIIFTANALVIALTVLFPLSLAHISRICSYSRQKNERPQFTTMLIVSFIMAHPPCNAIIARRKINSSHAGPNPYLLSGQTPKFKREGRFIGAWHNVGDGYIGR